MRTLRPSSLLLPALLALLAAAPARAQAKIDSSLSFFITSENPGQGGALGGLDGADAHCQMLAAAVGAGHRTWRAYLSTQPSDRVSQENARDRIGKGPWFNAKKVRVAASVEDLHGPSNNLGKRTSLTEKGDTVNGRGDAPNRHDILTGSKADGTAYNSGGDSTCGNWSRSSGGGARLGHHDKVGGGEAPESWNSAHLSRGCSLADLQGTGGAGLFYCFAAAPPGGSSLGEVIPRSRHLGHLAILALGGGTTSGVYRFELESSANVRIEAFAPSGRRVAVLAEGRREAGRHVIRWEGRDASGKPLPRGVYTVRLSLLD